MSVKCPACGFDSPDGSRWCDFCKEPFQKKAPPQPAPSPAEVVTALPEDPEEKKKAAEKILEKVPDLLRAEEKPVVEPPPPWLRPVAWAFLLIMMCWGLVLGRMACNRVREAHGPPSVRTAP